MGRLHPPRWGINKVGEFYLRVANANGKYGNEMTRSRGGGGARSHVVLRGKLRLHMLSYGASRIQDPSLLSSFAKD